MGEGTINRGAVKRPGEVLVKGELRGLRHKVKRERRSISSIIHHYYVVKHAWSLPPREAASTRKWHYTSTYY